MIGDDEKRTISGHKPASPNGGGGFEFKSGGKTIAVEFTDQKLSAHAGTATFWARLGPHGWSKLLARQLPHAIAHVAYFRRDPLVPELLAELLLN